MKGPIKTSDPRHPILPISFAAEYGTQLGRAVSLGGGGVFLIAWQTGYLSTLAEGGVFISQAERLVGTSAGSVVAAILAGGGLHRAEFQVRLLMALEPLLGVVAPSPHLNATQQRARDLFMYATDGEPSTIRAIGHAALAAKTPGEGALRRSLALFLGRGSWSSPALNITAVDAYTGERAVFTKSSHVSTVAAAAASSSVPGVSPPQTIHGVRYMDGGVSGTGVHLDLVSGARKVLVLTLTDGSTLDKGMLTYTKESFEHEVAEIEHAGSRVLIRTPQSFDLEAIMDPSSVKEGYAMGREQGKRDLTGVRAFWNGR